jgi:hypothetical protein
MQSNFLASLRHESSHRKEAFFVAKHEMPVVVNNQVVDDDHAFADGFRNGYLYYYDTNHQPASFSLKYWQLTSHRLATNIASKEDLGWNKPENGLVPS